MSEDLVRVAPSDARRPARAASTARLVLPQLIVDAGPVAVARFLEFFAARIANRRTRAEYGRAVGQFLAWCAARGLALEAVSPLHVAAYIRTHPWSAPTVKQHLAAIRMLGDWLVVSQVIPVNPAAAVRGPKHVVTKGATPVLAPAEARRLLEAIDPGTLAGLRDRALVSVMLYSFARVSAVIAMRSQDYFRQERRGWLRLHEKGGTRHDVPAHHRAAEALDDYLARAGRDEATAALFQSVDPAGRRLTGRALSRRLVLAMIKRRAAAVDLPPSTCCHTFRATGITAYLSNGGTLEHAQQIAVIASLLFMGGLRRSEVAALRWADVTDARDGDGVLLTVRTSKTNQEGDAADVRYLKNGAANAIRTVRADWPDAAPTDRVVGLSPVQIQRRFTAAARAAGIEARVTAHSGRVGLASELTARGASTTEVMLAGNWKTARMVAHYSAGATAERGAVRKYL